MTQKYDLPFSDIDPNRVYWKAPNVSGQLADLASKENVDEAFLTRETIAAQMVALYRDYAEGKHRYLLTDRQAKMLDLPPFPDGVGYSPVADDEIENALDEITNIIRLQSMESGERDEALAAKGNDWIDSLLEVNNFDALQADVHFAALRDGDSYVFCNWDNELKRARFYLNSAFDGDVGIIPVYDYDKMRNTTFFKLYTDKYAKFESGGIKDVEGNAWLIDKIPLVQFSYRRMTNKSRGISYIRRALLPQDALNQSQAARIVTSKFDAYRIFVAINAELKGAARTIAPGALIDLPSGGPGSPQPDFKVLMPTDLAGHMELHSDLRESLRDKLALTSSQSDGANMSGEALKVRKDRLTTRASAAQVRFASSWKELLRLAWVVERQHAEGTKKPPPISTFKMTWYPVEERDWNTRFGIASQLYDRVPYDMGLMDLVRAYFNFDEAAIERWIVGADKQRRQRLGTGSTSPQAAFLANDRGLPDGEDDDLDGDADDDADE